MANKFDNAITLDGAVPGGFGPGTIEWENGTGVQQAALITGFGVPVGALGGRLTGAVGLYIRLDAASNATVLYVTFDMGVTWTALT